MIGCKPSTTEQITLPDLDTVNFDLAKSLSTWILSDTLTQLNGTAQFEQAYYLHLNDTLKRIELTINLSSLQIRSIKNSEEREQKNIEIQHILGYEISNPYLTLVYTEMTIPAPDSTGTLKLFAKEEVHSGRIDQSETLQLTQSVPSPNVTRLTGRTLITVPSDSSSFKFDLALFLETMN